MSERIVCENLGKHYTSRAGDFPALRGVSLSVEEGDFVSVVGPSGAGKSTLLHILGAIDRPTEGRVSFGGLDINKMSDRRLAEFRNARIGFVFQFYHLLPEFSVLENVMLPAMIAGARASRTRQKALGLLERAGLGACADKYSSELSGGEMQRAAICRAVINGPGVILADEPTGNLDSESSLRVMGILRELNENEGKTLIIATHDGRLAKSAKRAVFIREGMIEQGNRGEN